MPTSSIAISAPAMVAEQHQLVEIAEMADAEHLAGDLVEAGAEREIVALIGDLDDLGGVEAFRHHDRGHSVGVPLGFLGAGLEAPGRDRGAHALGEMVMTRIDLIEAFLEQNIERLAQAVEQRQRRRVGK